MMRDSDRAIPRGGAVKWERVKQERMMGRSAGERILAGSWKNGRAWTPSQSGETEPEEEGEPLLIPGEEEKGTNTRVGS